MQAGHYPTLTYFAPRKVCQTQGSVRRAPQTAEPGLPDAWDARGRGSLHRMHRKRSPYPAEQDAVERAQADQHVGKDHQHVDDGKPVTGRGQGKRSVSVGALGYTAKCKVDITHVLSYTAKCVNFAAQHSTGSSV